MTDVEAQVDQFGESFQRVRTEIAKVIVGHTEVVEDSSSASCAVAMPFWRVFPVLAKRS